MEIEEYGLANVMRTGYADGGMSAREEKVRNRLEENKSKLKAAKHEWGVVDEAITTARLIPEAVKESLRDLYDLEIRSCEEWIAADEAEIEWRGW